MYEPLRVGNAYTTHDGNLVKIVSLQGDYVVDEQGITYKAAGNEVGRSPNSTDRTKDIRPLLAIDFIPRLFINTWMQNYWMGHSEGRFGTTVPHRSFRTATEANFYMLGIEHGRLENTNEVKLITPRPIGKYTTATPIINTQSGQAIPNTEPVFILRAQDKLAIDAIVAYHGKLPVQSHYIRDCVNDAYRDFVRWRDNNTSKMKFPD